MAILSMTAIASSRRTENSFRSCRWKYNYRSITAISSWCFLLLLLLSSIARASAFASTRTTDRTCPAATSSALFALPWEKNDNDDEKEKDAWNGNDLFESFKNFFWNKDKGNPWTPPQLFKQPGRIFSELYDFEEQDEEDDDDELPAGTSLLFKIPAKQLKPGGLRLFLMFYLMGMQNTPDRNTWRADQRLMSVNVSPSNLERFDDLDIDAMDAQPEEKTYVLEMLYDVDRSGMLQIELLPSTNHQQQAEIRIYRCGSRPTTAYLMQESVVVDGVLDELQNLAGEKTSEYSTSSSTSTSSTSTSTSRMATTIPPSDSDEDEDEPEIAEEDRLLITDPPNAIVAARESLAFS